MTDQKDYQKDRCRNRIGCNFVLFLNYLHLTQSVLEWISGGQVALGGDAHHEEGLEGHQDVLRRVPHVREEQDERLVLQVEVEVLGGRRRILFSTAGALVVVTV